MTATNHALTGAIIGLVIGNPWVAIPVAFISHFVLDSLPHFGLPNTSWASKFFRNYLLTEASMCGLVVLLLGIFRPDQWWVAAICAFVAASPDFMWTARFVRARLGRDQKPLVNPIMRFHAWVQWGERPWGLVVELPWFLAASYVFVTLLKV